MVAQTAEIGYWWDAVGYIAMGIATLLALPAFARTGFERRVRWALIANTLVTPLIATVYFYPVFSNRLLFLGFPWASLHAPQDAPLERQSRAVTPRRRPGVLLAPRQNGITDDIQLFTEKLREWQDYYNCHRPHGALGGQTPYERLLAKTRATGS